MSNVEYRRSGKDAMKVEFRLQDAGSGTFEGYLNYWGVRDSYDTEWHPQAWSRAGMDKAYPLQDMHATASYTRDTLGMFTAAEDESGLRIERGAFAPTQAGQDGRALAHLASEFGQPAELSVGFQRILTADMDELVRSDDPNVFTVTKLKESSLIIPHFASQPGAGLTSVRMQADALRNVVDSDDLLDPSTEARIIDLMTDQHGRKRQLVIRVGWEDPEERGDEEAPSEEDVAGVADLTDDDLTGEPLPEDDERASKPNGSNAKKLHDYWTKGAGLAKWADKPHPWTALYKQLRKYIKNPAIAKATAAKWYKDVKGHFPGQKKRSAGIHEDSIAVSDVARPLTVANPGEAPPIDDPGPVATPFLETGRPVTEATSAVVPPAMMTDPDGSPTAEGEVPEDLPTSTEVLEAIAEEQRQMKLRKMKARLRLMGAK